MNLNIIKRFLKAPWSVQLGFIIIGINLVALAFAPLLAPFSETEIMGKVWEPGFWAVDCSPEATQARGECWAHFNAKRMDGKSWLGTDNIGRDMFSRILFGARNTISIALVTTILSFLMGALLGFLAATMHGWVDQIISRIIDIMMAFPTLIFALIVLSVAGTSTPVMIIVIALLDMTRVFRLSRAVAVDIEVMEYVEAARLRGEGIMWLMRREILPNTLPPLVAEFGLRFCFVFLFISALSFLGLGLQPPMADWGSMVKENSAAIVFGVYSPLIPAIAIAFLTIGVNLVVDWFLRKVAGLRDEY
ncbi:MAG: ABC transporter permease [Chloroflexi bacterium]|jgi:peptide/nickel transport system permease protein|nr:ABC transporter permease [Chloroflexota bacterium]